MSLDFLKSPVFMWVCAGCANGNEATANVDPENESQLQSAIEALTKGKTLIMIAHRLKTVRHADQILVLDDGRLAGRGTHEELLENCPVYREIYYSQFPKEAVSNG